MAHFDFFVIYLFIYFIYFISRGKDKYKHSLKQYKTTLIPISPRRIAQKKQILSKGLSRLIEINKTHTNLQKYNIKLLKQIKFKITE